MIAGLTMALAAVLVRVHGVAPPDPAYEVTHGGVVRVTDADIAHAPTSVELVEGVAIWSGQLAVRGVGDDAIAWRFENGEHTIKAYSEPDENGVRRVLLWTVTVERGRLDLIREALNDYFDARRRLIELGVISPEEAEAALVDDGGAP